MRALPAVITLVLLLVTPSSTDAFCGFYVGGADAKLFNDATMTVLMRDGTRTVLSMQNAYKGPPADFAMVVPVPVVLQQDQVKTLPHEVFDRLDQLSAPRLVEYWEQDPCQTGGGRYGTIGHGSGTGSGFGAGGGRGGGGDRGVTIEAEFTVGEYDIVILSAKDAQGLDGWLRDNNYKIPAGAEPFLKPYVEAGMKFFVARVDVEKVTMKDGRAVLSPLRFHYDAETFSLPVRLGLINSAGTQDLIIHILARGERYEVANYGNVTIPTNLDVADSARDQFGAFYAALFDQTLAEHPGSVVTEYAWDAGSCDPCPASGSGLSMADATTLGADVLPGSLIGGGGGGSGSSGGRGVGRSSVAGQVSMTPFTVTGALDKEILRRFFRRKMAQFQYCYEKELVTTPALTGVVQVDFTVDGKGHIEAVKATGMDARVTECVTAVVKSIEFPKPIDGGKVVAQTMLRFAVAGTPSGARASGFTLTRLHVRYGKDALGEDLIFRVAKPIVGGREHRNEAGALEQSALPTEGGTSFFQARYAIRHEWKGAIACEKPVRGVWGGKPGGHGPAETKAARDLASAPRGGVQLASFVVGGQAAKGLVLSPAPASATRPPVATAPAAESGLKKPTAPAPTTDKKGCGCQAGSDGGAPWSSAALALLVLLAPFGLRAARARRGASRRRA